MFNTHLAWKRIAPRLLLLATTLVLLVTAIQPAPAQTLTTLYSFGIQAGDGAHPGAALLFDAQGNLYGTTGSGGRYGLGTAFNLSPAGTETVLHSFGRHPAVFWLSDGAEPSAGMIFDAQGNLYGTTPQGGSHWQGSHSLGAVFKLTPTGKETLLHSFAGYPDDGANPSSGLIFDAQGNLYGTTYNGGTYACPNGDGCGTVFKLAPDGTETVLHSFAGSPSDGTNPEGTLAMDAQGNLYGTTFSGGAHGWGTVFKLTPTGTETVLYSFEGYPDGAWPTGVILDKQGNLYGTTFEGGTVKNGDFDGCGTVFKVTPKGNETVLHSFAGSPNDGEVPWAGLVFDSQGNLYGTTYNGGPYSSGTAFKLAPNGTEAVLHSFTLGADGGSPQASMILDAQGNLYGTTVNGGYYGCSNGCGTVFKLTP